jgi:hypothetical protein
MTDVNQVTIDTGRGYEITGHAFVEETCPASFQPCGGRQSFATGQTGSPSRCRSVKT